MNIVTRQELEEIKKFTAAEIEMIKEQVREQDMELFIETGSKGLAQAYIENTDIKVDRITYELCYRIRLEKFFASKGK
jgi:hypothetical protein